MYKDAILYCPKNWSHHENKTKKRLFNIDLRKSLAIFELNGDVGWHTLLRVYLFHSYTPKNLDLELNKVGSILNQKDVCCFLHIQSEMNGYEDSKLGKDFFWRIIKKTSDTHPIALFIGKNSSKTDVEKYIKDKWPLIELRRKALTIDSTPNSFNLKNSKSRPYRERDNFIFKNSNLSRREIAYLVERKFKQKLSFKYISVIKKRERNRRQQ
jgi:hypothetical protein